MRKLFALTILLSIPVFAAKNLYVSTTGNDATTYGNNDLTHPWLTFNKAHTTADSGDTVRFFGGDYSIASTSDNRITGHNGTKAHPIVFMCKEGDTCTVRATSNGFSPVVAQERPYFTFHGIKFVSGYMFFHIGDNAAGNIAGTVFDSCIFVPDFGADNQFSITINIRSDTTTIQYCRFIGFGTAFDSPRYRYCPVGAFQTKVWDFTHNYYSDCLFGPFQKHGNVLASGGTASPSPATRSNSRIRIYGNYGTGSIQSCIKFSGRYADIRNNVCAVGISGATSISLGEDGGYPGGDSNTITHNTFTDPAELLPDSGTAGTQGLVTPDDLPGSKGNTLRDNIYRGRFDAHAFSSRTHLSTLDYNAYYSNSASDAVRNNGNSYTFSGWKTFYGQDAHSVAGAPTFAGGSSPATLSDFRLNLGSVGKGAASDGQDMGAMIDSVGNIPGGGGNSCAE